MKEYQKAQIHDIETNSNTKNIRNVYMGINDFKKGYQSRTNIVKDEKGDLVTDSTVFWLGGGTISLLLIGHKVTDVRWTETLTAESLVP